MTFFAVVALGLLFAAWLSSDSLRTEWRRGRLRRRPFPAAWRDILRRRVPYYRRLPADLQLQLKRHILVFLAEKSFVGCDGLEIDDDMRVIIAAQACLLLLNQRRTHYFPRLHQILVYPGAFVANKRHTDAAGLVHETRTVMTGESWSHGQVILAWDDVLAGAENPGDGRNVVIHEFAHQLDQEKGHATGAPLLARARYRRWHEVMTREFTLLRLAAHNGEPSLFDYYGATDPAEFFAVISETFFERPTEVATLHPELYRELSAFYRLEPLSW